MASIVCFSDKLNSGQYLGCNDFLFICESGSKIIGAGIEIFTTRLSLLFKLVGFVLCHLCEYLVAQNIAWPKKYHI